MTNPRNIVHSKRVRTVTIGAASVFPTTAATQNGWTLAVPERIGTTQDVGTDWDGTNLSVLSA